MQFALTKHRIYVLLPILALTFLTYLPALSNGFTNWDDDKYILMNDAIKGLSAAHVRTHFTQFFEGNYHPLSLLSLSLDHAIGGLDPFVYHLINLVFHLVNTALVYYVVLLVSGRLPIAAVAALLFGIHPMHVESVAWIAERKDVLYAFFFLVSLVAYIHYVRTDKTRFFVWSVVLFLCSMLSKAMAVSLVVTLVALDVFLGRKLLSRKVLLEKVPFVLFALVLGWVAIVAQQSKGAVIEGFLLWHQRLLVACYGLVQYVWKLMLPLGLSPFYAYPAVREGLLPSTFWFYPVIVLVLAGLVVASFRYSRLAVFGAVFFAVNVALVLQWFPVGSALMADRYVYVASIGFFLIVGTVYDSLLGSRYPRLAGVALAVYTALLCVSTYRYTQIWKDDITLWNSVIAKRAVLGPAVLQPWHDAAVHETVRQSDRRFLEGGRNQPALCGGVPEPRRGKEGSQGLRRRDCGFQTGDCDQSDLRGRVREPRKYAGVIGSARRSDRHLQSGDRAWRRSRARERPSREERNRELRRRRPPGRLSRLATGERAWPSGRAGAHRGILQVALGALRRDTDKRERRPAEGLIRQPAQRACGLWRPATEAIRLSQQISAVSRSRAARRCYRSLARPAALLPSRTRRER